MFPRADDTWIFTLCRVAFGTCRCPEPAVEISALADVRYGSVDVELGKAAQEREGVDGAVEKAGVRFAE